MAVKQKHWLWFGFAGHFIGGPSCLFHMVTQVGPWLVSTVGDYRPLYSLGKPVTIGAERLYETMVFKAGLGSPCKADGCNCGIPSIDGIELEMAGYNDAKAATEGHMALCRKWALL